MAECRYTALLTSLTLCGCLAANASCAEEPKIVDISAQRDAMIPPALRWLAAQQNEDGSWSQGNDMRAASPTELTGLALLAYLSAGHSHREGEYKIQVNRGLFYLNKKMKIKEDRGDLRGPRGDMTAHAIATIALCEAYAMTHDKELLVPAHRGITFINARQDKESGGWKEDDMAPPSVVVSAWQLLAMKSAHTAYLQVSKDSILDATKFLDAAQFDNGSGYPNIDGKRDHRATAAGLVCRMLLGWKWKRPEVVTGLAVVGKGGPRPHDVVSNYFANRLHYNAAGKTLPTWRVAIVKQLHDSQVADGDEAGSWRDADDVSFAYGGAIQQTALNVIILQTFLVSDRFGGHDDDDEFEL